LGNAVNGSAWDGESATYFQDNWDSLMTVIMNYSPARVAFTLGNLDTQGNLKDPKKIIQYINSYQDLSMTFISSDSIEGTSFYALPVHSSQCNRNVPLLYLFFFDSNTDYCKRLRGEPLDPNFVGCVSETQISKAADIIYKYRSLRGIF
jgi:hypothetical protein